MIPAFITAALNGRPLLINGDGEQSRDFTHVDDVTSVISEAVSNSTTSIRPVNLAFGSNTSLLDLIKTLEALIGRPLEKKHQEARVGDVKDSKADPSQLRKLFSNVRAIPLIDGLDSTLNWNRLHTSKSATDAVDV